MKTIKSLVWLGFVLTLMSSRLQAQAPAQIKQPPEWLAPIAPFHIAGNIYYVGSQDLASYLVVTPRGNILINSSLEASVPLIKNSIEQLGFKFSDTKILLISHAHFDHDAGSAAVIQQTGAKYMVMDGDVAVVESGGKDDFAYSAYPYPVAEVERILHDGDVVSLGGTELVAHKTPGHTRGCTTWTLKVREGGRKLNVVIVGSWNVNPGFRLVDKPKQPDSYPGIAEDYRHTFEVLKSLPCDIVLGAHGDYFDMAGKLERLKQSPQELVWVDPAGYKKTVAEKQQAFEAELKKQQDAN